MLHLNTGRLWQIGIAPVGSFNQQHSVILCNCALYGVGSIRQPALCGKNGRCTCCRTEQSDTRAGLAQGTCSCGASGKRHACLQRHSGNGLMTGYTCLCAVHSEAGGSVPILKQKQQAGCDAALEKVFYNRAICPASRTFVLP